MNNKIEIELENGNFLYLYQSDFDKLRDNLSLKITDKNRQVIREDKIDTYYFTKFINYYLNLLENDIYDKKFNPSGSNKINKDNELNL